MNSRLYITALMLVLAMPVVAFAQVDRGARGKAPVEKDAIKQPIIRRAIPSGRTKLVTPPENIDLAAIKRAQIPRAIMDVVAKLGDPDFAKREAASQSLRVSSVPDNVLMKILESTELDYEQRHRLLRVMRWRVLYKPRGAVGIQMKPGDMGIEVTRVISGLPAEKVLKVGDQIARINGKDVQVNNDLVGVVQSMLPGTMVQMLIYRPDIENAKGVTEIEVEFPLGSYEKLENNDTNLNFSNPETDRRNRIVEWLNFRYATQLNTISPGVQGPPFVPANK